MNPTEQPLAYWWPLATSHQLGTRRPLARVLHGRPLVLFRESDGRPAALPDRCPHRFAPLSAGCVRDGAVECPYHGWRFDGAGQCIRAPGSLDQGSTTRLLQPLQTLEAHGLIWVRDSMLPTPPLPNPNGAVQEDVDQFWMHDQVRCSLQEAAENFLDAFHTHFVHAGWIRRDDRRQRVIADIRALEDGIEARYSEEGKQAGLISRLFEGSRGESFGRFRLPGLAEIEYRDARGRLTLLISAWLIPAEAGQLQVIARIVSRRGWLPGWLKQAVMRPLLGVVLRQDKRILEAVSAQHQRFADCAGHWGPAQMLDGRQDLLGPWIRQLLLHGKLRDFTGKRLELEL
ncbi:Rieske 2Fe-2S domain-containing protein [Pseudomonas sp. NCCP-436]|uniref:Rieske 2Fe-2S domain-containing protein n=1 Tax=Pseudomonas sp. NCCP-436 TaxID=2842481 RepID=UPI001C818AF0|nr:Rieske 2Fe-2S domain-containing protein [Pseudomonas sp. NCCP-436]GIZ10671.1 (Fe-S)-binding protein [Pseudomonas sp. NCCP-436]